MKKPPKKEDIETEVFTCPYCKGEVHTLWVKNGGMISTPDVDLVGDWVYHSLCWDKLIEEHPP